MYFRHGKTLSVDGYENANWKLEIRWLYKPNSTLAGARKPEKLLLEEEVQLKGRVWGVAVCEEFGIQKGLPCLPKRGIALECSQPRDCFL